MRNRVVANVAIGIAVIIFTALCVWGMSCDDVRQKETLGASGYEAGLLGQPPESGPYYHASWGQSAYLRNLWLDGWRRGDADRRKEK